MKVLVTGSSGFVGSHLMRLLKKTEFQPIAFEGDLTDLAQVEKFFAANPGTEQIVHLAGAATGTDINQLRESNVKTTDNLLKVAVENGVKKVVFASSYGVYGVPINDVSRETDETKPDSPYGLSKKEAEDVIQRYHEAQGLEFVILRFASIYGPDNTKGAIFTLKNDAEGGAVTVYGDGEQRRNYLHVDDACRAIIKALFYPKSGVFNVAEPTRWSVNELVREMAKTRQFEIVHKPANNPSTNLAVDVSLAERELGFTPTVRELRFE